jgi:hypothetical protein
MRTAYPSEVPQDSALDIVHLFRDGEVFTQRALFASAVWNVQGYLQGLLIGNPYVEKKTFNPQELDTLKVLCEPLSQFIDAEELHHKCADACDVGAVPWASIVQMAQMVMQMLMAMGVFKKPTPAPELANPNNIVKEEL